MGKTERRRFQGVFETAVGDESRAAYGFRHEVEKSGGYGSQTDDELRRARQTDFQTRRLARGDGVARGAIRSAADGDGERAIFSAGIR